jgi:hypothetical protein
VEHDRGGESVRAGKNSATMKLQLPTQNHDSKKRVTVTFDESELAEHDKERGTRMIIPDPDTPFMRSPIISDDEESSPTVPRNAEPARFMATVVQDYSLRNDDDRKKREFEARRKAHYNEIRVLRGQEKSPSNQEGEGEDEPSN